MKAVVVFPSRSFGNAVLIDVVEDLDVRSCEALARRLALADFLDRRIVVVSMLDCAYCDAAGLGVLIAMKRRLGARLVIVVRPDGRIARLFQVADVTAELTPYYGIGEAFAHVARG